MSQRSEWTREDADRLWDAVFGPNVQAGLVQAQATIDHQVLLALDVDLNPSCSSTMCENDAVAAVHCRHDGHLMDLVCARCRELVIAVDELRKCRHCGRIGKPRQLLAFRPIFTRRSVR